MTINSAQVRKVIILSCSILAYWISAAAQAQSVSEVEILERLRQLEARQAQFESLLDSKDNRIRELEDELAQERQAKDTRPSKPVIAETVQTKPVKQKSIDSAQIKTVEAKTISEAYEVSDAIAEEDPDLFGDFTPGRGYTVGRSSYGELELSLFTYVRYLNQKGLDSSYIDHFGDAQPVNIRNDVQVNKVFLYTLGWFLDPRLRYRFYVWSTNTALGTTTNNLVAGDMSFKFSDAFRLTGGVVGLPATRSMMGQFPNWHRVDNRLIADEFMRGSFTQGFSADGQLIDRVSYKLALGNNLSNFGVSANQLDDSLNTISGALTWMPTTGEYGPRSSIGDFEHHTSLATMFGLHATSSTEDKQSQPNENAPENTQIRLSDGLVIFTPDALAAGVTVDKVDYKMFALNGGMKYRGFTLEGELFYRILDNFQTNQPLLLNKLVDKGFQVKTSKMLWPKTIQLYANGSKIIGEYGNPWDAGLGFNWWPLKKRGFRINSEAIYLRKSPVGYASLPYVVGANGWIFVTNAEVAF